jgi:hypothetical protein
VITGIRKSSKEYKIGNTSTDVLLCIFDMCEVRISRLSSEEITEVIYNPVYFEKYTFFEKRARGLRLTVYYLSK